MLIYSLIFLYYIIIIVIAIQEYVIRIQRGPLPDKPWRVSRRYNDFVQLNAALSISGIDLALPPKKIIGNMEPDFVAQRQIALQVDYSFKRARYNQLFHS